MREELTVWVTHTFPGLHHWPDAPAPRAYLRGLHRHLFHVRVELAVGHDDRQVEFHDLLDVVRDCCANIGIPYTTPKSTETIEAQHHGLVVDQPGLRVLGQRSCEQIARHVAAAVHKEWPGVDVLVEVSEDGEAGACLSLTK